MQMVYHNKYYNIISNLLHHKRVLAPYTSCLWQVSAALGGNPM